jgi:hypothetical protein
MACGAEQVIVRWSCAKGLAFRIAWVGMAAASERGGGPEEDLKVRNAPPLAHETYLLGDAKQLTLKSRSATASRVLANRSFGGVVKLRQGEAMMQDSVAKRDRGKGMQPKVTIRDGEF